MEYTFVGEHALPVLCIHMSLDYACGADVSSKTRPKCDIHLPPGIQAVLIDLKGPD